MSEKPRVLEGNLDDVVAEMEREDAEGAVKLSPREYALLRGKKPQLVYYYIRKKKLVMEKCICGRNVIDVEAADKFFAGESGTDGSSAGQDGEGV
jgi:hypothetical protein